jgi:hypothetical protein
MPVERKTITPYWRDVRFEGIKERLKYFCGCSEDLCEYIVWNRFGEVYVSYFCGKGWVEFLDGYVFEFVVWFEQ